MQKVVISPGILKGSIAAPPSKSVAHRAVICASLARGESVIKNISLSQDIIATIDAVRALGASVEIKGDTLIINGGNTFKVKNADINCRESGSTLRFMLSVAAAGGVETVFNGEGRLPERPIDELLGVFEKHGVKSKTDGSLPVTLNGSLTGGAFEMSGNISSQFITGLMLALPLCREDSEIRLTTRLESKGYTDITIDVLKKFGVIVEPFENGWLIRGGQSYKPCNYTVEGDWSQAAFYMAASVLGSELEITGLNENSAQGDMAGLEIFRRFGADITQNANAFVCRPGDKKALTLDASQIPDLVPIIAVTASVCKGTTVITGVQRLRLKESDRIFSTLDGLKRLGVDAGETADGIIIKGTDNISGGEINGFNDHRIVMAFSILSLAAKGEVAISDAQSINKSYPDFFRDYNLLGGKANVINLG